MQWLWVRVLLSVFFNNIIISGIAGFLIIGGIKTIGFQNIKNVLLNT